MYLINTLIRQHRLKPIIACLHSSLLPSPVAVQLGFRNSKETFSHDTTYIIPVMILIFEQRGLGTEEQSHQGLHCLLFHLRLFDRILYGLSTFCLNFKLITARFSGFQKFMDLTLCLELSMDYSNNYR